MRKWLISISLCFLLMMGIGCKKNSLGEIDHHIVGIYFEFEQDEDYKIGIGCINPSIYYCYADGYLYSNTGIIQIRYDNLSNVIFEDEKGVTNCVINVNAIFSSSIPESEVKVYQIYEDNAGNSYVNKKTAEKINLDKEGNYYIDYIYKFNGKRYHIQFKLGYMKRGA